MRSRWAVVLAAISVMAGVLLLYARVNVAGPEYAADSADPRSAAAPAPSRPDPTVRVEHDLLVIQPAPVPRGAPRRAPDTLIKAEAAAAPRVASRVPRVAAAVRQEADSGVAARAGRILLGDGRYRPEPFPKPDAGK